MANVRLIHPVRHNGENKQPDDVIPGLTDAEAARLVRLGVGVIDEDSLPDMEDASVAEPDSPTDAVGSGVSGAKPRKKRE